MEDIEPIAGFPNKRTMLEVLYAQEGLSINQISARVGVSAGSIVRWMRLLEIPRRSRGGDNSKASLGWKLHRLDPRLVQGLSIRDLSRLVLASESYCYKFKKGVTALWNSALSAPSRG